jgi:tetratricopeptide (TPR) repeat protein
MVLGVGRIEHKERHPKLWAERGAREIVVGALRDKAAEKLVRTALGPSVSDERVRKLVDRAGGNPYFLEELIRAEAEGHGDETPETVLAMVEARLLRLPAESRRVLRAASVYAARFDARAVAAVLGETSAITQLEALTKLEWLAVLPGGGYAFRQETSRDAAYAMLLDDDKRLAHARAAELLEGTAEPDAAAIAEHFERAEEKARAAPWWTKAAQRALEGNDFRACVARAEAAERCGAEGAALHAALAARAEAHLWLGESRVLLEVAERLIALGEGKPEWEAVGLRWGGTAALRLGATDRLAAMAERARALVLRHPTLDVVLECALAIARPAAVGGLPREADGIAAAVDGAVPPLSQRPERLRASAAQLRAYLAHHDHDWEAQARLSLESVERLLRAGLLRQAASMQISAGYALFLLGAHEEAVPALEASITECARLGLASSVAGAQQNLGLALSGAGRHEAALSAERESIEAFVRQGDTRMECCSRTYVSRILLAAGRIDEAIAEASRAAPMLAADHPFTPAARAALADALLARGQPGDREQALDHARAARDQLRASPGSIGEPAPILRVIIDALEANGLSGEAARERADAQKWVTERARRIESQKYRRTFLEADPDNARIMAGR